jgi:hypothetical protein
LPLRFFFALAAAACAPIFILIKSSAPMLERHFVHPTAVSSGTQQAFSRMNLQVKHWGLGETIGQRGPVCALSGECQTPMSAPT